MANLNLNEVILGGRLTADVEQQATPNGVAVAKFAIAINRSGKSKETDFIDCVAWRQTAEFISKYFQKGSSICVRGEIQKRSYEDKNGNKRYITEVIVNKASFVDSKSDGDGENTADPTPQYSSQNAPTFAEADPDDDLPF